MRMFLLPPARRPSNPGHRPRLSRKSSPLLTHPCPHPPLALGFSSSEHVSEGQLGTGTQQGPEQTPTHLPRRQARGLGKEGTRVMNG